MLEGTIHPDFADVAAIFRKILPQPGEGGAATAGEEDPLAEPATAALVEALGQGRGLEAALPEGWRMLDQKEVTLLLCSGQALIDASFPLTPDARPDSGTFTLAYTEANATRAQGLQFLLATEDASHTALPFFHQERVAALAIEPLPSGAARTWLVADGELVDTRTTVLEVHPGVCRAITAA